MSTASMEDVMAQLKAVMAELTEAKEQMAAAAPGKVERPLTVAELIVLAETLTSESSLRTYRSSWRVLAYGIAAEPGVDEVEGLGGKFAHEVTGTDLQRFLEPLRERAKLRNAERDLARFEAGRAQRFGSGEAAVYNAVGAGRRLFAIAESHKAIAKGQNPAAELKKPSRLEARRTWLNDEHIAEVVRLASSTGDDPELDGLLCQFHLITGARQEGAVNLRVRHVNASTCMVVLDEKNSKVVAQPVPDWLANKLLDFAASRGSTGANDPVFVKKTASGRVSPLTPRRYNYLFERLQSLSAWMDEEQVTAHTLRHCAGKLVERHAGKMVAQAFLRHSGGDVTGRYTRATPEEVANAVIDLWGGTHPLASSPNPQVRAG